MPVTRPSEARLNRVFMEGFSVKDIAEPFASFDDTSPAPHAWAAMNERGWEVVGVRKGGLIVGYAKRHELGNGKCGDTLHAFDSAELVHDAACLPEVAAKLVDLPRLFVTSFGEPSGIVTRADLQKPPVRMWLFGIIALIEMGLTRLIQDRFPDGGWQQYLFEGRLAKAESLMDERKRKRQELDLLDCLSLSDKGRIVLWNEDMQTKVGFVTRTRGEETFKELETLRYNLAHPQDKIICEWNVVAKLAAYLDGVFGKEE